MYCMYCGTRQPRSAQNAQYFASTPVVQPRRRSHSIGDNSPPLVSLFLFLNIACSLASRPSPAHPPSRFGLGSTAASSNMVCWRNVQQTDQNLHWPSLVRHCHQQVVRVLCCDHEQPDCVRRAWRSPPRADRRTGSLSSALSIGMTMTRRSMEIKAEMGYCADKLARW